MDDLIAAIEDDRRDAETSEKFHEGAGDGVDRDRFQGEAEKALVLDTEPFVFMRLHAERLDDSRSGDGLLEQRGEASQCDLRPGGDLPHFLAELGDGVDGQRKDEHRNDGQLPVPIEDDNDQAQQCERILQQRGDRFRNGALDVPDVVGDSGHQDAGRMFGEKGEGLELDFSVEFRPQVGDDPLADKVHQDRLEVVACPLHEVDPDHGKRDQLQHVGVALQKNLVEGRFDQEGKRGGRHADDEHAGHGG